jgi:hypothetical protein
VKVINLCDGGKNCWAVVKEMGVGHTQIMNTFEKNTGLPKSLPVLFKKIN